MDPLPASKTRTETTGAIPDLHPLWREEVAVLTTPRAHTARDGQLPVGCFEPRECCVSGVAIHVEHDALARRVADVRVRPLRPHVLVGNLGVRLGEEQLLHGSP